MTEGYLDPYIDRSLYIPASLSEIYDLLGAMILDAPTFIDPLGYFPDRTIDTRFQQLTEGAGLVRPKLGEERYAALIDLAARAKALFAADPDETNGKTREGLNLLQEIEEIIQAARRRPAKAKLPDEEGEVTGD